MEACTPGSSSQAKKGAERTVREVVRAVVTEVASDELPLVVGLAQLDETAALRALRRGARHEPLGFGLGEVVVLVTPVVWLVLDQVAQRIANAAVDGASKGGTALLRKIFRRRRNPAALPPLSPGQLAEVRRELIEAAVRRGLDDNRASAIADAVVSRLAVPDQEHRSDRSVED